MKNVNVAQARALDLAHFFAAPLFAAVLRIPFGDGDPEHAARGECGVNAAGPPTDETRTFSVCQNRFAQMARPFDIHAMQQFPRGRITENRRHMKNKIDPFQQARHLVALDARASGATAARMCFCASSGVYSSFTDPTSGA